MKLCKDCKHYRAWWGDLCYSPKSLKFTNPITGIQTYFKVTEARNNPSLCYDDAAWFEPKRKWWKLNEIL